MSRNSVASQVRNEVDKMVPGTIFTVEDLSTSKSNIKATKDALYRIYTNSIDVVKVSDGLYSKPKVSTFGVSVNNRVRLSGFRYTKAIVRKANSEEVTGYEVGDGLFNKVGLTTQVPMVKEYVSSKRLPRELKIAGGYYRVKRDVKRDINCVTVPIYEFAYILNNIKKVQDIDIRQVYPTLKPYLDNVDERTFKLLMGELKGKTSKALLGALFSEYEQKEGVTRLSFTTALKNLIEKNSKYTVGVAAKGLSFSKVWKLA
ncbi:DUF6088 family protein [uncultured Shewanella sp.]|jgi:hypothetical protein|uniref:DUF6088 family protein n=1 Tax=uncultured Shewanella sp. TaxID=173975 RepID=UPI003703758D